jgi:hypothetical protein
MKKSISILVVLFSLVLFSQAIASDGPPGPAPNSGDGISDGSGLDSPNGPNGDGTSDSGNGAAGPAPNSGDGIPDGSGF